MSPSDESNRLPGLSPLATLPFETKEAVILGLDRPGVNMLGSLYEHILIFRSVLQIMGDLDVYQIQVEAAWGGGKNNVSNNNNNSGSTYRNGMLPPCPAPF